MQIGGGTHGSVYINDENTVRKMYTDRAVFIREAAAIKKCSGHPNIIELVDIENMNLILPRYHDTLKTSKNIPNVLYQLLCAIKHAANYGFMHRDIKPANILVSGDNVILADWGLARYIDLADDTLFTQNVITANFKPPYIEHNGWKSKYDHRADVWSIAKVGIYLMTYSYTELELSDIPSTCSDILYDFIEYVLTNNPQIDEALSHELFNNMPKCTTINQSQPTQIYHRDKSAIDYLQKHASNMLILTTASRIIDLSNYPDFTKLKHAALNIAIGLFEFNPGNISKSIMPVVTHVLKNVDVYADTFYLQIIKLNKQLKSKYNVEINVPDQLIIEILSIDALKMADCTAMAAAALSIAWGRKLNEFVLNEFNISIPYVEYLCGFLDE